MAVSLSGLVELRAAAARPNTGARSPTVAVTITDSKLTLSPRSVPAGAVRLKVTNVGKLARAFSVAGRTTPKLAAGTSAVLKVVFTKPATYIAVASAAGGRQIKATLKVVAVETPPTSAAPTTTSSKPTTTPTTGSGCSNPVATTVTVAITDGKFTFSQTTIPCGTVTFVLTNNGSLVHSLQLSSAAGGVTNSFGQQILPGQTVNTTVDMRARGPYPWVCGEREDNEIQGESGTLTVQ